MKYQILLSLCILLFLQSCKLIEDVFGIQIEYSEYFNLNDTNVGHEDIVCCNMSKMGSVEREDNTENAIYINPTGLVSLKNIENTQFISDMTIELLSGEGIEIYSRLTRDKYDKNKGIKIIFDQSGCRILENGTEIGYNSTKLEIGKKYRLVIKNEAEKIKVMIDCDDIFNERTKLASTEYIILSSLRESRLHISGIEFTNIFKKNELVDYSK